MPHQADFTTHPRTSLHPPRRADYPARSLPHHAVPTPQPTPDPGRPQPCQPDLSSLSHARPAHACTPRLVTPYFVNAARTPPTCHPSSRQGSTSQPLPTYLAASPRLRHVPVRSDLPERTEPCLPNPTTPPPPARAPPLPSCPPAPTLPAGAF